MVLPRSCKEFMMWNHLAFVYEIYLAITLKNYILALLGISTTALSILYHRTHEQYWQPHEKISIYISEVYILSNSWFKCSRYYFGTIIALSLLIAFWHRYSYMYGKNHYELCHPWLHLLPPLMTHIYQVKC